MIYSIKKNDKITGDYQFVENIKLNSLLEKGISFKPGINILIGENGCGKSTVMNIIKEANLVKHSFKPEAPEFFSTIIHQMKPIYEAFEIKQDISFPVFNLYRMAEDHKKLASNDLETRYEFHQFLSLSKESKGQNLMGDLSTLFNWMFHKTSECNPTVNLLSKYKSHEDGEFLLEKMMESNVSYKGLMVTILMDEPDQGLDIDNLNEVYEILSQPRGDTQIIAAVHNPILIYKLSKNPDVNLIEISEGYLDKIKTFVEK